MATTPLSADMGPPAVPIGRFRFTVKIMPPRGPDNSISQLTQLHYQPPPDQKPMGVVSVPTRITDTFAQVWDEAKRRYETGYGAAKASQGYFHKLQDCNGAIITVSDCVGDMGFGPGSRPEDLILIMLQNAIDRDGSIADNSTFRPPGYGKRTLTEEQSRQVKRRKVERERFGAPLDEINQDTPITSREPTDPVDSKHSETAAGQKSRRIDADGFVVPVMPRPLFTPKRHSGQVVQSSIDGEDEENVLVQDSQGGASQHDDPLNRNQEPSFLRTRVAASVPAATSGRLARVSKHSARSTTLAPRPGIPRAIRDGIPTRRGSYSSPSRSPEPDQSSLRQDEPQTGDDETRDKSLPTPISGKLPSMHEEPPESSQRPRTSAPSPRSAHKFKKPSLVQALSQLEDEDPIEDDDLLPDIADEDFYEAELLSEGMVQTTPIQAEVVSQPATRERNFQSGGIRKRGTLQTPKVSTLMLPNSSAVLASGRVKSSGSARNPRASTGPKNVWSASEDSYVIRGLKQGLTAAQMVQRFDLNERTSAAVRGRISLLKQKNPLLATQTGQDADRGNASSQLSSSQKSMHWAQNEIIILSQAIAEGFDALEIQAMHFPKKSQDSVNRKVMSLQDSVWKKAQEVDSFPENTVKLRGWTLKESCKLRRAWRERRTHKDTKLYYLSRWPLPDVIKKCEAYEAQCRRLKISPNSRAAKDVLPTTQEIVESSPAQRSMQSKPGRNGAAAAPQVTPAQLPSSSTQPTTKDSEPSDLHTQETPVSQNDAPISRRGSSPQVRVSSSEQDNARQSIRQTSLKRQFSGSGGQTTLDFYRDKGKGRAGPARSSDADLDARYKRGKELTATIEAVQEDEVQQGAVDISSDSSPSDDEEDEEGEEVEREDDGVQTTADDLEMLEASLDVGSVTADQNLQPPVSLRPESDPRAASQLSEELQHSLPSEARKSTDMEVVGSQAFQTQDPKPTRSQRKARKSSSVVEAPAEPVQEVGDSQAFQTQDPATSRSQRQAQVKASREARPSTASPTKITAAAALEPPDMRTPYARRSPPKLSAKPETPSARALEEAPATQSTTSRSGKLPARGISYASRIHDAQNLKASARKDAVHETRSMRGPQPIVSEQASSLSEATSVSQKIPQSSIRATPRGKQSPMQTDADIWAKVSNVPGCSQQEIQNRFENLKSSKLSIQAMQRGDWEEVKRLRAADKRRHRESEIASGEFAAGRNLIEHPDGPATQGDLTGGDENVIRADDDALEDTSDEDDDFGGTPDALDDEEEEEEDMDRGRHFSELEDDEDITASETPAVQQPRVHSDIDMVTTEHARNEQDDDRAAELPSLSAASKRSPEVQFIVEDLDDAVRTPLTAKALSQLESETESLRRSPFHSQRRRRADLIKASAILSTPERQQKVTDDRAAMPPPSNNFKGVSSSSVTNMSTGSKKAKRSKRQSKGRRESASDAGSMASSSSILRPSNRRAPSGPAPTASLSSPTLHNNSSQVTTKTKADAQLPGWSFSPLAEKTPTPNIENVATAIASTPIKSPKASNDLAPPGSKTAAMPSTAPFAANPKASLSKAQRRKAKKIAATTTQLSAEMQALLRKAHIPSPPKPKKASPPRTGRFHRRLSDDEDDDSSSSSSSDD